MAQADWASITCQPQQTTFATEWQALTYSGNSQADLEFGNFVEVVLFGGEVQTGRGRSPVEGVGSRSGRGLAAIK